MDNEQITLEQVKSRQIDAGFIAYSSLSDRSKRWAWVVPQKVYEPIEQGAVLITKDNINDSAKIWMGYLNSDSAKLIIQQSGYGIYGTEQDTAVSSSD
jgi:molybdate transport system substrate-binding protein